MDFHQMPEMFCGFPGRNGEGPTLYPVACSAWASAAVFMLLQSCLGLRIDTNTLQFDKPLMPPFLDNMKIYNLKVGSGTIDISLERHPEDVGINVLRRNGKINVLVRK